MTLRQVRQLMLPLLALSLLGAGHEAAEADPAIGYRQKLMENVGANMGAVADILKHGLPLLENVPAHARNLERSAAIAPAAFRAEVADGPTDAKPGIWQDFAAFEAAARKMGEEAGRLAEVAEGGDRAAIGAQLKALGQACRGCHEDFRKPKEESYKRAH